MDEHIPLETFDEWLKDESDCAALVFAQRLAPVGPSAVVFPPTYTLRETDVNNMLEKGSRTPGVYRVSKGFVGYNIDHLPDGTTICQIDSVGSQANRMEPLFMRPQLSRLVPNVTIDVHKNTGEVMRVNLLEASHRIADAVVRFSSLHDEVVKALLALKSGNAEPLAKLAPTSIVFGAWDSRDTQVKIPRLVHSVITAYNVHPQHRSAQYTTSVNYRDAGVVGDGDEEEASEVGMAPAPATLTHGGVLVRGRIERQATLLLEGLRSLEAHNEDGQPDSDRTLALRRYILGLSLVALTAPQPMSLRQGCHLIPDPGCPGKWELVRHDGKREDASGRLSYNIAVEYAECAAKKFGVGLAQQAKFNANEAKDAIAKKKPKGRKVRQPDDSAQLLNDEGKA